MRVPIPFKPSRNIKEAEYDDELQELYIVFRTGGSYTYSGVSQDKANEFSRADSAGQFLHARIKNQHDFTKDK